MIFILVMWDSTRTLMMAALGRTVSAVSTGGPRVGIMPFALQVLMAVVFAHVVLAGKGRAVMQVSGYLTQPGGYVMTQHACLNYPTDCVRY